jgi:hypothetical protein
VFDLAFLPCIILSILSLHNVLWRRWVEDSPEDVVGDRYH